MNTVKQLVFCLWCLLPAGAQADWSGYSGTHSTSTLRGLVSFRHRHDWDSQKVDDLYSDLTHPERFFSADNDFAFVEARNGLTLLFRSPAPALTHLWISPGGEYFVGLSNVKLRNPFQLVVWRRDGTLIGQQHISDTVARLTAEQRQLFASQFPSAELSLEGRYFTYAGETYVDFCFLGAPNELGEEAWKYLFSLGVKHPYSGAISESVTNWVHWYDENNPDPSLTNEAGKLTLRLRDPSGKEMNIPIGDLPEILSTSKPIDEQHRIMLILASIFAYGGVVALLIGYLGIVFCGFADGIGRGIRNLILPILGFGDAMRRYHFLIWLWAGGLAAVVLGALLRP